MKRIIRIATLLTVIALGIENVPGAQAFISEDDSIVSVNKKDKLTEYKGIRVDPKPIDLLWQNASDRKTKESTGGEDNYSQNHQVFNQNRLPEARSNTSPNYLQPDKFYLLNDVESNIFICQKKLKQ